MVLITNGKRQETRDCVYICFKFHNAITWFINGVKEFNVTNNIAIKTAITYLDGGAVKVAQTFVFRSGIY